MRLLKAGDVEGVRADAAADRAAVLARETERQAEVAAAYASGFDDGMRRALASGAEAAPRGAAALEALLRTVEQQHAGQVQATSRTVLAAAVDIARWVLRAEVAESSRGLLARLEQSAAALLPSPTTRVRVSAGDADAVREWAARRTGVEVVVDATLPPGDAAVETDAGSIDVSVAAALRLAADSLGLDPETRP